MKHHFVVAAVLCLLLASSIASAQQQGTAAISTTATVPAGQVVPPGVVVPPPPPTPEQILAATAREAAAGGLGITDLKVGKGAPALPGTIVAVHYTGWLQDATQPDGKGSKFDSSRDNKQPFVFPLGQRRVIRGWDLGVVGMQVGGQRRLVIPAVLAYGDRGAGNVIPPGATLIFDVELLAVDEVR